MQSLSWLPSALSSSLGYFSFPKMSVYSVHTYFFTNFYFLLPEVNIRLAKLDAQALTL